MKWYRRGKGNNAYELFLPYKREYANQRVCYGRPNEYGTSDLGSMTP